MTEVEKWLTRRPGGLEICEKIQQLGPAEATQLAPCPECRVMPGTPCDLPGDYVIGAFCHRVRVWQVQSDVLKTLCRKFGVIRTPADAVMQMNQGNVA
jgi:hypothetical protein